MTSTLFCGWTGWKIVGHCAARTRTIVRHKTDGVMRYKCSNYNIPSKCLNIVTITHKHILCRLSVKKKLLGFVKLLRANFILLSFRS